MPPTHLMIKPASSLCNLACKYCFYQDVAKNRAQQSYGIMSFEILEKLVTEAMIHATGSCTFIFQGGEPTLAGLDFYKELIRLQNKYNRKGLQIYNSMQTNGLLLNEEWVAFLTENHFLIGLSLDGPKDIHDALRTDAQGIGSFSRVMDAVSLLNKHKAEYNILCVVTNFTARHAEKVYRFFKKNGFGYLQFIPCLDPLGQLQSDERYSLTPERYGQFLKQIFDCYYTDFMENAFMSIRAFDNYIGMLLGHPPESCGMSGTCTCAFVIEADGSVYPCDFYCMDDWQLGSISTHSFDALQNSKNAHRFVEVSREVSPQCKACRYYALCRGGCRRNREPFIDGIPMLNHFCSSYIDFFGYALPRMQQIARIIGNKK